MNRVKAVGDHFHRLARVHAALGDPVRLALVDDLASSDRTPTELAARHDLPSNLLSHHLGVLEAAGVIERFASSGDRRRRYVRLVREPLAEVGVTLTRLSGSVLFVCSHNSARSQLAAAIYTAETDDRACSAGTSPAEAVHPGAVAAAHRVGLDIADVKPRTLRSGEDADVVVTVCDRAHEELEPASHWRHWSIPDPVSIGTDEAFDAVVAELRTRITTPH